MIGIIDYLRAARADGDEEDIEYYENLLADHEAERGEADADGEEGEE